MKSGIGDCMRRNILSHPHPVYRAFSTVFINFIDDCGQVNRQYHPELVEGRTAHNGIATIQLFDLVKSHQTL